MQSGHQGQMRCGCEDVSGVSSTLLLLPATHIEPRSPPSPKGRDLPQTSSPPSLGSYCVLRTYPNCTMEKSVCYLRVWETSLSFFPWFVCLSYLLPFRHGSDGKESACDVGDPPRFDPCVGKIPWRRKCQFTPVFFSGEFLGQTSLVGYSMESQSQMRLSDYTFFLCVLVLSASASFSAS